MYKLVMMEILDDFSLLGKLLEQHKICICLKKKY